MLAHWILMSTFWEEEEKKYNQFPSEETSERIHYLPTQSRTAESSAGTPAQASWLEIQCTRHDSPAANSATGVTWPLSILALNRVHVFGLLFQMRATGGVYLKGDSVLWRRAFLFKRTQSLKRSRQFRSPVQHPATCGPPTVECPNWWRTHSFAHYPVCW